MGPSGAMISASEPDHSIIAVLDDSWCSECVLKRHTNSKSPSVLETGNYVAAAHATSQRSTSEVEALSMHPNAGECSTSSQSSDHHAGPSDAVGGGSDNGLGWCYSIDEAELRAVFRTFDENADGLISVEELKKFTISFGIEMSNADAESMIASVDDNADGGIDFQEFYSLYRTHLVDQRISKADEGKRSQEENEIILEAFKVFDKDGDGLISAVELKDVLQGLGMPAGKSLKHCMKMIRSVDCDGDGQCDIREFQEMMTSKPLRN